MSDPAQDLLTLLDLERLEINLFRGQGGGGETLKRIFGGHVIAQALAAACRTVEEDRRCHSLHAYFIRPGDPSIPIIFEVDRSRDGGSFATRRVVAIQHGRQILSLAASFQVDEPGWEHQHDMPEAPPPDGLRSRKEIFAELAPKLPEELRPAFLRPRPVDVREVTPLDPLNPQKTSDRHQLWFRFDGPPVDHPWLNQCLLAYASDMSLLGSGTRRHGVSWLSGEMMGASLDHAMWFHAPVRFDEWHLYHLDSPFAGGARSFNRGMIFSQDGRLVASVSQEGLMRPVAKKG